MKVARLLQPRNPMFWIMLVLNVLSLVLGWIARTYSLDALATVLVTAFAIGNALLGTYFAWRLVHS